VQRETAQSKTGTFRDYGVAEAPSGLKAGWSGYINMFLYLFILLADLNHEHFERLNLPTFF
jgi:hypothetical protein